MATSERFLDDILHFLSPLNAASVNTKFRTDGIIETDVGFFKIAYTPPKFEEPSVAGKKPKEIEPAATALFYARHADDLAGTATDDGRQVIAHPERIYLVNMDVIRHSHGLRWHPHGGTDEKPAIHLDLSWLDHKIPRTMYRLSRAALREATLHRLDHDTRVSAFIGYQTQPAPSGKDENVVRILTKLDRNYCVPELAEAIDESAKDTEPKIVNGFRASMVELFKRGTQRFDLHVKDADGADFKCFKADDIGRAVNADFAARLDQIFAGSDPVQWHEHRVTPILRVGARLAERLKDYNPASEDFSWEEMIRTGAIDATHLLLGEGLDFFKGMAMDAVLEKIGLGQPLEFVPHHWQKMVKDRERHLVYIDSDLHNILHSVNPNELRDLEWVDFSGKRFATQYDAQAVPPDAARAFCQEVISLFRAPYGATFTHRDDQGNVLNPEQELDDTRVLQVLSPCGIHLHYDTYARVLYGFYHKPAFEYGDHRLPDNADAYLRAGEVVMIDMMEQPRRLQTIPQVEFIERMQRIGKPEIHMPLAETAPAPDTGLRLSIMQPQLPPARDRARDEALAAIECIPGA